LRISLGLPIVEEEVSVKAKDDKLRKSKKEINIGHYYKPKYDIEMMEKEKEFQDELKKVKSIIVINHLTELFW